MALAVDVQLGAALGARRGSVGSRRDIETLLRRAVRAALHDQLVAHARISITLLDDAEIAELNEQFLSHEGPTDVISFPLYEAGEDVVGDVYIGYEQARRQSAANDVALDEELVRLAVHGTLHVLGHDHPDGGQRTRSAMWKAQERIVSAVMST